jgi:hypothetical protein
LNTVAEILSGNKYRVAGSPARHMRLVLLQSKDASATSEPVSYGTLLAHFAG